ncbi:MAG: hypothetical protein B7Z75_06860 [Acidocella sp. 20-57-95]|nr:MAG: hypothetical protein B7Z75_06860 [Acidocella sp. 20-57-95]OYV58646.1 MAG: hypothetical protein B7Z71_09745 [Acidocella sp. 21-58-7]HQT63606.1 TIGR04283 family arsenosugar biosynthesis glycosyltransferase [Acidocella sp.]HQU05098.1 TIGR04283 family arsenosugar biosynthesis glycosyltransferase [Acidocella sp.]
MLSVVIPTLNAAHTLPACLTSLAPGQHLIGEIIIVDGGSRDETLRYAGTAKIIHAPPGRGGQLRAGIAAASGAWLMLLHADTQLSTNWPEAVAGLGAAEAGYFRLKFISRHPMARLIERGAALRCLLFKLPYGDQGLVISQNLLAQGGGMPDLPLMEDVALVRRLRRFLRPLPAAANTSAERYERGGWVRRPLKNLFCLALYFLGVPPAKIKRLYG